MLCLPVSLQELLLLFAPCFSRATYRTFCALVVGQISQTGLRTVTGMLAGARLSGVWHHARAHRFFSQARWSADELGLRVAVLIAATLTQPGDAILVAVDDTLLHRLGRKIHACFWHHDATANSDKAAVAWGNNWVVIGIVVELPFLAVGLPADHVPLLATQTQAVRKGQARPRAARKGPAGKGHDRAARRAAA
jgi:hypothetical protein